MVSLRRLVSTLSLISVLLVASLLSSTPRAQADWTKGSPNCDSIWWRACIDTVREAFYGPIEIYGYNFSPGRWDLWYRVDSSFTWYWIKSLDIVSNNFYTVAGVSHCAYSSITLRATKGTVPSTQDWVRSIC
ncbi:hypothetical protein OHR68_32485 [Spirillospora sp. NBC_00431]